MLASPENINPGSATDIDESEKVMQYLRQKPNFIGDLQRKSRVKFIITDNAMAVYLKW